MKKLYGKTWAKLSAAILFCLCAALCMGCVFGMIFSYNNGWPYGKEVDDPEGGLANFIVNNELGNFYYWGVEAFINGESLGDYSPDPAVSFVVRNEGKTVLDTRTGDSELFKSDFFIEWRDESQDGSQGELDVIADASLDVYVNFPISPESQWFYAYEMMKWVYGARTAFSPLAIVFFIISAASFVFLMCAAGKKEGKEGVVLAGLNRAPLDLYAVVLIFCGVLMLSGTSNLLSSLSDPAAWLLICLSALGFFALFTALCMTLAARFKGGKWWRNTLIYKLLALICKWLKALWNGLKWLVRSLPLVWKTVMAYLLFFLLNLILFTVSMGSYGGGAFFSIMLALIFDTGALLMLVKLSLDLRKLFKGGKAMASGDLSYTVDTSKMRGDFKAHGESLNSVSLGVSKAVEERMKSERFKTELITNVSHDLKTPLTSIVSYVDLLKKENIENENAREYIEVLDRQSTKLKKLTEDLVEASKASSGVISANKEKLDLRELTSQCAGEYGERLTAVGVELISSVPQEEMIVLADGRLLWRVLDNVMQNVVKYAMAGTRAYLGLESAGRKVCLSVKNISREPLNIPAEELMERFVRGDASRSTDGSGLGLSIARSLMELMGAELRLTLDGDLFKVALIFDKI